MHVDSQEHWMRKHAEYRKDAKERKKPASRVKFPLFSPNFTSIEFELVIPPHPNAMPALPKC